MKEPQETISNQSNNLAAAQLEKLKLEIEDLRNKGKWDERISRYIPLISVLVTVAGFTFGVYQFRVQHKANLVSQEKTAKFNDEQSKREFAKPLFEKQLALYLEATEATATIANTQDPTERKAAEKKFWQLYYGPLAIVESKDVSGAMKDFGDCLDGIIKNCDNSKLQELSLILATKAQKSIAHDWGATLFDFAKDKFHYDEPE
ncbi:MAG TPA: hypothetical protein VE732_01805 [Nitrososphaera sp.]|nr:hypothetical protein [Nitrososphaera sp.]